MTFYVTLCWYQQDVGFTHSGWQHMWLWDQIASCDTNSVVRKSSTGLSQPSCFNVPTNRRHILTICRRPASKQQENYIANQCLCLQNIAVKYLLMPPFFISQDTFGCASTSLELPKTWKPFISTIYLNCSCGTSGFSRFWKWMIISLTLHIFTHYWIPLFTLIIC